MADECDRCEDEFDELQTVELDETRELCQGCVRALTENVETYRWQDLYTEEQHERAVNILSGMDEIECVIESYDHGQIIVHTPYVTSGVVTDICDHFGLRIVSFAPMWVQEDSTWDCMKQHGSIFQIVLQYDNSCDPPVPIDVKYLNPVIDEVSKHDKQF